MSCSKLKHPLLSMPVLAAWMLTVFVAACGPQHCDAPTACLAIAQHTPHGLVVDRGQVFWTEAGGGVHVVSTQGGDAKLLVPPQDGIGCMDAIAVTADLVYFMTCNAVWSVPRGGGTAAPVSGTESTLGRGLPSVLAVDTDNLYWLGDHQILSRPHWGGPTVTVAQTGTQFFDALVVSNANLFWAVDSLEPDRGVWTVPVSGGAPRRLVNVESSNVTVDAAHIYFGTPQGIQSAALDGSGIMVLVPGNAFPGVSLTHDAGHLYWIDITEQSITSAPFASGNAMAIVREQYLHKLDVDDIGIYYMSGYVDGGAWSYLIKRAPKPS